MSFTVTGVAILALALLVFLRRPQTLMYWLIFFAPFSATAVVNLTALGYKSGGVGVTPAIVLALLMFAAQPLFGGARDRLVVGTGHLLILIGIAVFTTEMLGSLMFNAALAGVSTFQLTQTVYMSLAIATTVVLSLKLARGHNIERALDVASWSAVFVSFWGLLQYGLYNVGLPYPSMLFNNSMSDAADMFEQNSDGFMRIASVAVEPSFFAASMLHFGVFGATLLMVEPRFRTRGLLLSVGITLGTLVISTATTAYIGLATFALLMLLRRPLMSVLVGAPLAALAGIGIASVPKLRDSILAMTVDKAATGSYGDRIQRMRDSVEQFYHSPIFGQGWSKTFNFNALTTLLANCGLVGTGIALITGLALINELGSLKPSPRAPDAWRLRAYAAASQNMLVVAFVCAVSSGLKYVVLDDACFGAIAIAVLTRLAATRSMPGIAWDPSAGAPHTRTLAGVQGAAA